MTMPSRPMLVQQSVLSAIKKFAPADVSRFGAARVLERFGYAKLTPDGLRLMLLPDFVREEYRALTSRYTNDEGEFPSGKVLG